MDLIIGIALAISFVCVLVYNLMRGDVSDTKTIVQLIISSIGSIIVLGPILFKYLTGFKDRNKKDKEDTKKPVDNTKEEEDEMDKNNTDCCLGKEEMGDFKALNYLKDRAIEIKSQEALDLVVKLNTILFANDISIKKEEGEKEDANKV